MQIVEYIAKLFINNLKIISSWYYKLKAPRLITIQ